MERERPLLIFDGNCGFCRIWIEYWRSLTKQRIDYAPSQEVANDFPQIPAQEFARSVQLVGTDGSITSGARAVFASLGLTWLYALVAWPSEVAYRFVASHRDLFYGITKWTFGTRIQPTSFERVQGVFIRALAAIYAVAFFSLYTQIVGLVGSHGILPVQLFLHEVASVYGGARFYLLPTLFWINASDAALRGACLAGVAIAAILFFRKFQRACLIALYALYLSITHAGQVFLGYQWDSLLLEAGFLAIFLGRSNLTPWLYRLLVFRLYFLSAVVKLASGDPEWRSLSALQFHFHTQPLPTFLAWYADKLPAATLRASTLAMFAIELGAPLFIFAPRLWRLAAAWAMISLQVLILATGNYTYFNWLTLALLLWLFDDQFLGGKAPVALGGKAPVARGSKARWAFAAMLLLGAIPIVESLGGPVPNIVASVSSYAAPFQIANPYGLFAVMTTERKEIRVEGSDDGEHWLAYEFRYKPNHPTDRPRWIAPLQPRLDWQMWFAALGDARSNPWFTNFAGALLEGSPDVLGLLARNPFPQHPPRYVRAEAELFTFSSPQERTSTGRWWRAAPAEEYLPAVALRAR